MIDELIFAYPSKVGKKNLLVMYSIMKILLEEISHRSSGQNRDVAFRLRRPRWAVSPVGDMFDQWDEEGVGSGLRDTRRTPPGTPTTDGFSVARRCDSGGGKFVGESGEVGIHGGADNTPPRRRGGDRAIAARQLLVALGASLSPRRVVARSAFRRCACETRIAAREEREAARLDASALERCMYVPTYRYHEEL